MQVKIAIPDTLYSFALSSIGTYPTRYDKILEEAFIRHKLMLGAHQLRQIAGGGSNTTAQEAVNRFRSSLHKSIASRIEFGADIPDEVSSRMSAVMADLWTACVQTAATEFNREKRTLEQTLAEAIQREQDVVIELSEIRFKSGEMIAGLTSKLNDQKESNELLINEAHVLNSQVLAFEMDVQKVSLALKSSELEVNHLQIHLDEAAAEAKKSTLDHEAEKERLKREAKFAASETKREHEAALTRVTLERSQVMASEAKEKSAHAETMIVKAKIEQRLSQLTDQYALDLKNAKEELEISKLNSVNLSNQVQHSNERVDQILADLRMQTNLVAKTIEQMSLMKNYIQVEKDSAQEKLTQ